MAFKLRLKRGDDAAREGGEQSTPEQTTWRKVEAPEGAIQRPRAQSEEMKTDTQADHMMGNLHIDIL